MKKALYIIIAVLSMASTVSIMAKGGEELAQKMYVFGVSTSFNDSMVFFTEIMELEGAWVESKTGFIVSRDNYSYQLRDHLASKGYPKRTCIFISGKNLKDVTKKYDKLKSRYVKKGRKWRHLSQRARRNARNKTRLQQVNRTYVNSR